MTPLQWEKELRTFQPDMLLVESAWRGRDDLWRDKIRPCSDELAELVGYCEIQKIPTVFWNKEDPYHFDDFIESAKLFDFVFTTDIECISLYKKYLDHKNIYLLPFGCQPKIHNPIEKYERKDGFVFAGAYYPHFPERNIQFANMISTLDSEGEIDIYDRNYNIKETLLKFPEEYRHYIRGSLDYDKIDKAYKGYKYAINLNSMTESPTMFSRRVFDLMASNTIVLSNYTIGTQILLGDLVISTDNSDELKDKIQLMSREPLFEKKLRLAALRKVMSEHTAQNRLNEIVSKVFEKNNKTLLPHITCVSYVKEKKHIQQIRKVFLSQNYKNKNMVVVFAEGTNPDFKEDENIVYIKESDRQSPIDIIGDADYFAGLCPDDYYGTNYLTDLALATRYSDANMITKGGSYVYDGKNELQLKADTQPYKSSTSAAARSSILHIPTANHINIIDFAKSICTEHYINNSIFAIDEFNYCKNGAKNGLGATGKLKVNDLQDIDTGISIDDKWIEKQLKIIEHEKEMKQKLVYHYKENVAHSRIQDEQIKMQKKMIEKMHSDLKQLKAALNSLITIPLLRHPLKKIKSYKTLIQTYHKLNN